MNAAEHWVDARARIQRVEQLREQWRALQDDPDLTDEADAAAQQWLNSLDQSEKVGARHHVVPKFLLQRWAHGEQVCVYSREMGRRSLRNVNDLAYRDFYTFVDTSNAKNSSLENVLTLIEDEAATALRVLQNPFVRDLEITPEQVALIGRLAAFQVVRTPRHRRETELHADWYAKTMVGSRIDQDRLAGMRFVPHPNDSLARMGDIAEDLLVFFLCRPLAVLTLTAERLLIGDEPVIVNSTPGQLHLPDCAMSNEEFEARLRNESRKKKGRRRRLVSRTVHFSTTIPRGFGVANEIAMPISPRSALVWGPLQQRPVTDTPLREKLNEDESHRFATLVNDAICAQALDWIIASPEDEEFRARTIPPLGPLMQVCDGTNAASLSFNAIPAPLRPARLWMPSKE